jgi:hypothetical protein
MRGMSVTRVQNTARPASRPPAALLDAKGRSDVLFNRQLPASSALGKVARRVDQEWGDANIMSGVVTAVAGRVRPRASDAQLKELAAQLLGDALKVTDELKPAGAVKTTVNHADSAAVSRAARVMALDGFVYADNAGNIKPVFKDIAAVLKPMGALRDLRAVRAQASVNHDDLGRVPANLFLFANYKTGEIAVFYARQGST